MTAVREVGAGGSEQAQHTTFAQRSWVGAVAESEQRMVWGGAQMKLETCGNCCRDDTIKHYPCGGLSEKGPQRNSTIRRYGLVGESVSL